MTVLKPYTLKVGKKLNVTFSSAKEYFQMSMQLSKLRLYKDT